MVLDCMMNTYTSTSVRIIDMSRYAKHGKSLNSNQRDIGAAYYRATLPWLQDMDKAKDL